MIDVVKIASYICQRYQRDFGVRIDEMKLHKLLYFAQRESFILTGKQLFDSHFKAWRYGPVLVEIRQLYKLDKLKEPLTDSELQQCGQVMDKVFMLYAQKDSWSLSSITHGEYAWKNARKGLSAEENGNVSMRIEDIERDAVRIKIRRFLLSKMKVISSTMA